MDEWHLAEIVFNGILTLAAAFAGAFFAFLFEKNSRKGELVKKQVVAGNLALSTLVSMFNKLYQYRLEIVEPYRTRDDAWLNLAVGTSIKDQTLVFDGQELSFLLLKKPGTFQRLFLEADRFHNAAELIDKRETIVLEEAWPRLSVAGIEIGGQLPAGEMERHLTVGVVRQLKILTPAIIKNVDEDIVSIREAFDLLRTALKAIYPSQPFIVFPEIASQITPLEPESGKHQNVDAQPSAVI